MTDTKTTNDTANETPRATFETELPRITITGKRSQQRTNNIWDQFKRTAPAIFEKHSRSNIAYELGAPCLYWQAVMAWGWQHGEIGIMKRAHEQIGKMHDEAILLATKDLWANL